MFEEFNPMIPNQVHQDSQSKHQVMPFAGRIDIFEVQMNNDVTVLKYDEYTLPLTQREMRFEIHTELDIDRTHLGNTSTWGRWWRHGKLSVYVGCAC